MTPRVLIIAGPNGAGKTTFAREFLPREFQRPNFVNADLIAAGLSPFRPETAAFEAGRLMLAEMERLFKNRENFAFETTLSGRVYAKMIERWQAADYRVDLIYLKIRSVRLAEARIKERVAQGGHSISRIVIRRRFHSGWRNFGQLYRPLVDGWRVYDNSGAQPVLIDAGTKS